MQDSLRVVDSSCCLVHVIFLAAQISRLTTQGARPRNGEHFYEREECNMDQRSNDNDLPNWLHKDLCFKVLYFPPYQMFLLFLRHRFTTWVWPLTSVLSRTQSSHSDFCRALKAWDKGSCYSKSGFDNASFLRLERSFFYNSLESEN